MHLCYTCHREILVHSENSHTVHNADNKRGNEKGYKSSWLQQATMLFKNMEKEKEHFKMDFLNFSIQLF